MHVPLPMPTTAKHWSKCSVDAQHSSGSMHLGRDQCQRTPVCAAVCARATLHRRGLLRTLGALAGSVRWKQVPHELQQDALPLYSAACIRVPEDGACGKCGQGYSCSGKPSRAAWFPSYPSGTDRRRDELSGFRPFRSEWRLFFRGRSCHPVSLLLHAQEMTPVLCVDGQLIRGSYAIVKFLATEMCARNRTCRCRNFGKFRRGCTL